MHLLVIALWCSLLLTCAIAPFALQSADPGDDLTRNTVRLALLFYFLALNLMLWPGRSQSRLTRTVWTLAWLAFVIHVAFAFHFFHDWSHAKAVEHVRAASGVGEGLFVSYLFTFVWTADVAYRWATFPENQDRPRWLTGLLHGFMLFVAFNATVIFEPGWLRWLAAACFAELGALALIRWRSGIGANA
jgi:hypothetical protein